MQYKPRYYNSKSQKYEAELTDSNSKLLGYLAYTDEGGLIGSLEMGKLIESKGIDLHNESENCIIGFCECEQKWYGWKDEELEGYGIGDTVSLGDGAFRPSNKEEFLEWVKLQYSNEMFENLEVSHVEGGLKITYDLLPLDADELDYFKKAMVTADFDESAGFLHIEEEVYPYPEWGRGEWTADNLDDAKQMACDFAGSLI